MQFCYQNFNNTQLNLLRMRHIIISSLILLQAKNEDKTKRNQTTSILSGLNSSTQKQYGILTVWLKQGLYY